MEVRIPAWPGSDLEEGLKDRPCAIVLAVADDAGDDVVVVLPITHTAPSHPDDAVEIPAQTKQRLGLDEQRSWVVVTEANRFNWPGPDLRPSRRDDPAGILYGLLPQHLFYKIRQKFFETAQRRKATLVPRSE